MFFAKLKIIRVAGKNYKYVQLFQRLGAFYYKENRKLHQLHKSCCFKIGCTFAFVLIQILCDKNYQCKKEHQTESESDNESIAFKDNSFKKHIKKTRKNVTEKESKLKFDANLDDQEESFFFHQSCCNNNTTKSKSHSCCPDHKENVKFDNKTSTVTFAPSFNLPPNKKSTPKPLCQKPTPTPIANNSNSTDQTNMPLQTVVTIETNRDNDNVSANDIDDTFYSA